MSDTSQPLELPLLPSLGAQLLRAAVARKPSRAAEFPRLGMRVARVVPDAAQLARYREVCGFEADGLLPVTFPQVLATPLHIALLNRPEFPYRLLGMIHVRNVIRQHQRLADTAPLSITCTLGEQREARHGREIDLHTRVETEGVLAWEAVTTMLRKLPGTESAARQERGPQTEDVDPFEQSRPAAWQVALDTGWRYARTSGDYNPIHLHAMSARLFGFPRAIAHGMWTLARCVAEMGEAAESPVLTLTCEFRRPLFLGANVRFQTTRAGGAVAFRVSAEDGTPHLQGDLKPTDAEPTVPN
ncbi:acyl dehydratase [Corallococcus sp. H22C18031201]|nr:acyl dehydratase [Corallococcus sp. H22C18031201]